MGAFFLSRRPLVYLSSFLTDPGRLPLLRAIEALTIGPRRVLGAPAPGSAGFEIGAPADLVVFDRSTCWKVTPASLLSKGKNSPLLGMELDGPVLLTIAGGRLAYEAADD